MQAVVNGMWSERELRDALKTLFITYVLGICERAVKVPRAGHSNASITVSRSVALTGSAPSCHWGHEGLTQTLIKEKRIYAAGISK
jgi:hypothetical protein